MKTNYYADQLSKIDVNNHYNPLVKIVSGNDKGHTNYMDINEESAVILIKWLNDNFIKK